MTTNEQADNIDRMPVQETATGAKALAGRSLVLEDVDWRTYRQMLRIFARRPGHRLAYDRGRLEIMSPLAEHEFDNRLLDRFVVVLTEELHLNLKAGGTTTLRRRRKRRGVEADNCYWIANEPRIRGKRRIHLKVDPPPDLAIEVDLTNSSLDRLSIYAALKVPEVWRLDNGTVVFHILGADGEYAAGDSASFPGLKAGDLLPFLHMQASADDNAIVRQFRLWVRERIAQSWQ